MGRRKTELKNLPLVSAAGARYTVEGKIKRHLSANSYKSLWSDQAPSNVIVSKIFCTTILTAFADLLALRKPFLGVHLFHCY